MKQTRPNWLDNNLYPFQSNYIQIDGHQVHYVDEGSGPILLCLHGNPTWSFLYRDIIKELRGDFRCIAPDYPGFGLSKATEGYGFTPSEHSHVIEKFIEQLDLKKIILLGQDYGGPIGLGAAGRNPERFAGFVIGNTFAWPPTDLTSMKRFSQFAGGPIGYFLIRYFNAFVNLGMARSAGEGKKVSEAVMAAYRGPFPTRDSRYPTYVFPRELRKSRPYFKEVAANLKRLAHLPLLLTWGDADPVLTLEYFGHRFQDAFPNHQTVILEGVGHFFQEEVPEKVAEAIRDWWFAL